MTVLAILLAVLLAIDWAQTLTIARTPQKWHEINPLLGPHPSVPRVHAWFVLVFCAVGAALLLLEGKVLLVLLITACVCEIVCVVNNFDLGIET